MGKETFREIWWISTGRNYINLEDRELLEAWEKLRLECKNNETYSSHLYDSLLLILLERKEISVEIAEYLAARIMKLWFKKDGI